MADQGVQATLYSAPDPSACVPGIARSASNARPDPRWTPSRRPAAGPRRRREAGSGGSPIQSGGATNPNRIGGGDASGAAGKGSPASSLSQRTAAQRVLRLKAARRSRTKKSSPTGPMAFRSFSHALISRTSSPRSGCGVESLCVWRATWRTRLSTSTGERVGPQASEARRPWRNRSRSRQRSRASGRAPWTALQEPVHLAGGQVFALVHRFVYCCRCWSGCDSRACGRRAREQWTKGFSLSSQRLWTDSLSGLLLGSQSQLICYNLRTSCGDRREILIFPLMLIKALFGYF